MPASVIVCVAALGSLLALNLFLGFLNFLGNPNPASLLQAFASLSLGGLILWGMIAGHRLAWQWGRVLGIIAAVILTLSGIFAFQAKPGADQPAWVLQVAAGITLFQAACLYVIFFALGENKAREYFRLCCPQCNRFTGQAADFFFNKAKCNSCQQVW